MQRAGNNSKEREGERENRRRKELIWEKRKSEKIKIHNMAIANSKTTD